MTTPPPFPRLLDGGLLVPIVTARPNPYVPIRRLTAAGFFSPGILQLLWGVAITERTLCNRN